MPRSCDPFRQNHRRFIVETLLDEYSDISDENLYLSIGKVTPWGVTNDNRVSSIDSIKDNTDFWRGMVAAKRINRSDVSLVVRRIDWNPGKVFDTYRDDVDLHDDIKPSDFYALVDDERVYVCIDNNNNSQSIYPPTHTDDLVRKLADGYRWKFLYQIPESKRKFLTKSDSRAIGYMPVEYVETLLPNDERRFQWTIQQNAVNGKIDFVYLDTAAKAFWVSTDDCLFFDSSNTVVVTVPSGATTINISSPSLIPNPDKYKDMMFSVDSGAGQGQRRQIKSYAWNPIGNFGTIIIDPLTTGLSGTESTNNSLFSITPKVQVSGDGFGTSVINPYITTADFLLKFGATTQATTSNCNPYSSRLVSGVEIVNGGKDYSFANLDVYKGITTVSTTPKTFQNFANLIHAVIPPPGGHGANAVRELGANAYMIVVEYDRDESGKVDTENDFRQFGILRNPLLREKQIRLKFYESGLSGSFIVGLTAGYGSGPYGKVLEWCVGVTGVSGTSELVLGDIRGGDTGFHAIGSIFGTNGSFKIYDSKEITYAGQEGRHLLELRLSSVNSDFSNDGSDYYKNYLAHGVGSQFLNVGKSRASGDICGWFPDPSGKSGILNLEFPKGKFNVGETVLQTTPDYFTAVGYSGPGRITSIVTKLSNVPSVYDLTTTVRVLGNNFDDDSFLSDSQVYFSKGITVGNGYIVDWIPATGGTFGDMQLAGIQGIVVTGQSVDYVIFGPSGNTFSTSAEISEISHRGELKYGSGDILYIQNINPIARDLEQREEIKLVIEL